MTTLSRRDFFGASFGAVALAALSGRAAETEKPNVILCMADDLGWGDVGFNGHPRVQTPNLDAMAASCLQFNRFYSGAPVCSPTRGSCLTGRHPYRYGIFGANKGHMLPEENTLAEVLRAQGYVTGHFGKWHLGTLTKTVKDSNRGGRENTEHYSPPWENGFDRCFSTEAKVPTCDPMRQPANDPHTTKVGAPYGTYYWTGPGERATENLEGDDSRIIMDRAVPFIEEAVAQDKPFFAVIWFHAPHLPVVAGPEDRKPYEDMPEEAQHYLGCITALDKQVGRLRAKLQELGAADNTLLWFCSDNGPEGNEDLVTNGTAGPFRGRKGTLYEGGVRVPGLLEWPARIHAHQETAVACSTEDYFPTVLAATGAVVAHPRSPMDGINLLPLLDGTLTERPNPIGFEHREQISLTGNRYKIISKNLGGDFALYDLQEDPGETTDLSKEQLERVAEMRAQLEQWRASCDQSRKGADY